MLDFADIHPSSLISLANFIEPWGYVRTISDAFLVDNHPVDFAAFSVYHAGLFNRR
jgi:hypothetical protein